jgi:transposase
MVRRKLTIPERWQAVGMHIGGFSHRRVADHFRVNHSIIVRLMQCFRQTGNVTDRPRAGRPRKMMPRVDWLISRRVLQQYACQQLATFLVWLIFAAPYQTNRKSNLKLHTKKSAFVRKHKC